MRRPFIASLAFSSLLPAVTQAGSKPWETPPTIAELMQGTSLAGVPYRQDNLERCIYRQPFGGAKPGIKGVRPRDLDKAVEAGLISEYHWRPHRYWFKVDPVGGEGVFLEDRYELSVKPVGGDFEVLHFRFDSSDNENVTVDAVIAYPRWREGMDRDAQLAALGLEPTQDEALISDRAGLLLRTQERTHRVLLTAGDDGQPRVDAVVFQCWPGRMFAFDGIGDAGWELRRALERDDRVQLRKWYALTSLYPLDGIARTVTRAREVLGDEAGAVAALQGRYDDATTLEAKLEALGRAYLESDRSVLEEDLLGMDRAALLAEVEERLEGAEGDIAATIGWSLAKMKLEQRDDEAARAALGVPLADLQRQVIGRPTSPDPGEWVQHRILYLARLALERLPIHRQLRLDPDAGQGTGAVFELGPQRLSSSMRTFEGGYVKRTDEPSRAWSSWKAQLDQLEHLFRMATEEMERNADFLRAYTAYESGACWETKAHAWYEVVREVDCTGWGQSVSWAEVDEGKRWSFEEAARLRAAYQADARELLANEPPKGNEDDYRCSAEVQEWTGSVERPWTVSMDGRVLQRDSTGVEIEPIALYRNKRCTPERFSSDADEWVSSADELSLAPVGMEELADVIGEQAREGVRLGVGVLLEPHLAGLPAQEAAWLRWIFGQDALPGDEAWVPRGFMDCR
jgi:hypothetical protein